MFEVDVKFLTNSGNKRTKLLLIQILHNYVFFEDLEMYLGHNNNFQDIVQEMLGMTSWYTPLVIAFLQFL